MISREERKGKDEVQKWIKKLPLETVISSSVVAAFKLGDIIEIKNVYEPTHQHIAFFRSYSALVLRRSLPLHTNSWSSEVSAEKSEWLTWNGTWNQNEQKPIWTSTQDSGGRRKQLAHVIGLTGAPPQSSLHKLMTINTLPWQPTLSLTMYQNK